VIAMSAVAQRIVAAVARIRIAVLWFVIVLPNREG